MLTETLSPSQKSPLAPPPQLSPPSPLISGTYDGYFQIDGQDGSKIYIKSTGEMIYLQGGAENSSESFTYTLSDGTTTDTATVTLNVTNANDAPVANDDSVDVTENSASTVTNLISGSGEATADSDADGDSLSITTITVGSTTTISPPSPTSPEAPTTVTNQSPDKTAAPSTSKPPAR